MDLLSDEQLRVTALDQAMRYHDGAWVNRSSTAQDVVETAEKFYEFLVKS